MAQNYWIGRNPWEPRRIFNSRILWESVRNSNNDWRFIGNHSNLQETSNNWRIKSKIISKIIYNSKSTKTISSPTKKKQHWKLQKKELLQYQMILERIHVFWIFLKTCRRCPKPLQKTSLGIVPWVQILWHRWLRSTTEDFLLHKTLTASAWTLSAIHQLK